MIIVFFMRPSEPDLFLILDANVKFTAEIAIQSFKYKADIYWPRVYTS